MKTQITILAFLLLSTWTIAQENSITISGGYPFAKIEDTETKLSGWRINALYEYNPSAGSFAHGLSVGYVGLSGDETEGVNTVSYDVDTWPIYYAPKVMFGSEKVKGFIKGAIGWQFSSLERIGSVGALETNDSGFAGGGGAGLAFSVNEKIFLAAEYELLWLSNAYFSDGWLNTASLGIGFRF